MSSFLPIPECKEQEIEAVRKQLTKLHKPLNWPTADNEPINACGLVGVVYRVVDKSPPR